MNVLAILALTVAVQAAAPQQEPAARAEAERDTVRLGEPFALTVTVIGVPPDARVRFPELADTGIVSALGPPAVLPERSGRVRSARYELAIWAVGDVTLPGGTVQVIDDAAEFRLAWGAVDVHAASALPADAALDTLAWMPAADVVGPNWSLAEKLVGGAIVLGALVGLLVLARRLGSAQPVPVPSGRPPGERALDALSRLSTAELAEAGELKAFYSRLAQIVRRYLAEVEHRWGMELTTRELVRAFADYEVERRDVTCVRSVLEEADHVKFARRRPTPQQALATLEMARSWIAGFEWPPYRVSGAEVAGSEFGRASGDADVLAELDEVLARAEDDGAARRRS